MENKKIMDIVKFIRTVFKLNNNIPLHEPKFIGNETKYLSQCIDSGYVSSVGEFVNEFEKKLSDYTGSKYAVLTVNGTEALHMALLLLGVSHNDEVITQPVSFIATSNSVIYTGAKPVFVDVDIKTLSISPEKLEEYLSMNYELREGLCINIKNGNRLKVCLPVHIFGHPAKLDELKSVCSKYNISIIEDAAESLGSFFKGKHTGTYGELGAVSFNGNKIITTGGGGAILTDNEDFAKRAKHLTTQAKVNHPYAYFHDEIGYNFRMPNINAALGVAQLEQIDLFIQMKRELASLYSDYFNSINVDFITEPEDSRSNYWLNAIILKSSDERDFFLEVTNKNGVMTRPLWALTSNLPMFSNCLRGDLSNSEFFEKRLVNIPSSVVI